MTNINKNSSLERLSQLVQTNISRKLDYMPDEFNEQQKAALELFQKRIFLEKTIDEALAFNRSLKFEESHKSLSLATTAEELIEVFKLRSEVYGGINYQDEFPDAIEGMNFDIFDQNSGVILYKTDNKITGTVRFIFDSAHKLPSEEKSSFERYRQGGKRIGELSRLIIRNEKKGLNQEFKYLTKGVYTLCTGNNVDMAMLSIITDHYKLYSKFGGGELVDSIEDYGNLGHPVITFAWDPSKASTFFKRTFLR